MAKRMAMPNTNARSGSKHLRSTGVKLVNLAAHKRSLVCEGTIAPVGLSIDGMELAEFPDENLHLGPRRDGFHVDMRLGRKRQKTSAEETKSTSSRSSS